MARRNTRGGRNNPDIEIAQAMGQLNIGETKNYNLIDLIPEFDGTEYKIKFFFKQFEAVALANGWEDGVKAAIIKYKLRGEAYVFLLNNSELLQGDDYDAIKHALMKQFENKESLTERQVKFNRMFKFEGETINEFGQRLKKNGIAFLGEVNDTSNKVLISKFLENVDPSCQKEIILKKPQSFDDAMLIALEWEKTEKIVAGLKKPEDYLFNVKVENKMCIACNREGHLFENCEKVSKLSQLLEKGTDSINKFFKFYEDKNTEETEKVRYRDYNKQERGGINYTG